MNDAQAESAATTVGQQPPQGERPDARFDVRRYLRVVRFFAGAFGHLIFWEIILRGLLGQRFVERSSARRWGRLARRFRSLAVGLGGVLIKLGQFLSIRVDVLPRAVTDELAGLQDEVAPERLADIQAVIETEYGKPMAQVFPWLAPKPEAAASLAQVHRARLRTGEDVVVKVQRPRIDEIVETDLRAIGTAIRWLKRYRPISRRVNLDRLYEEFSGTTRRELDFVAEAQNAKRFALNFADDSHIRIPDVFDRASTRRVLIMENVASIKITDYEAIEAAGINRQEVAHRLFDTYLTQVFVHNFVHADPHPGNLFVQPMANIRHSLGIAEPGEGAPFRLTFVDFGMVAAIPERVRPHLSDFLVGFVTKDSGRIIRAYQGAGMLLPGADLVRLEEVQGELLGRYSGLSVQELQQLAMSEWQSLAFEYRDILYEMPFQLPADLLFVGRAIAILFGMATALDPTFDPWKAVEPFAREMAAKEMRLDWRGVLRELEVMTRLVLSLPAQADRFFGQATRGELAVRTRWSREDTRTLRRVETAVNRLASAVAFAALLLSAVLVHITQGGGIASYVLFALAAAALLASLFRR